MYVPVAAEEVLDGLVMWHRGRNLACVWVRVCACPGDVLVPCALFLLGGASLMP